MVVPCSGNHAAHFAKFENPAQRETGHIHIRRNDLTHFLNCIQSHIEIDTGKGFPAIELFAMSIITAVIIGRKLGRLGYFAAQ